MTVEVGVTSDPDNLPGLAHLCEHVLYLGTQKYLEKNSFQKFIHWHGRMLGNGAVTSLDSQIQYSDVSAEHLEAAFGTLFSAIHRSTIQRGSH